MYKYIFVFLIILHELSATIHIDPKSSENRDNASSNGRQWLSEFQVHANNISEENYKDVPRRSSAGFPNHTAENSMSGPELSWLMDIPFLPIVFATSASLPDGRCKNQVRRYSRDLRSGELWAVQMYDASTKYPDGIINGHMKHLGSFDQCYNLHADLVYEGEGTEPEEISGRYCLVDLEYRRKNAAPPASGPRSLQFDPNDSVWKTVEERGDFRRLRRYVLQMALCVPSTCSAADVEAALKEPLEQLAAARGIDVQTSVKPELSQALEDAPPFSTAATIYCCCLLALFVLVVASSWYDSSLDGNEDAADSTTKDVLLCFSARRNFQSIFDTKSLHPGLDCIHLIRFISMAGVILGHRMLNYGYPIVDTTFLEKSYKFPLSMFIFNGTIIVDGFFAMSGILLAYCVLEELDIKKRMNFSFAMLIRFLRLTPMYMVVVFFNATLMPHLGSGPYWESKIGSERDNCMANWWTNLLYINNYVNEKHLCMFQSWYLSVDFHMYILGLFAVYAFWRWPRSFGYTFLGVIIASGAAITSVNTYVYHLQPIFMGLLDMQDVLKDPYFVEQYIKSHERVGSYFVGIVSGAILHDYKGATWKLPKVWSRILFILLAVGLTITSQFLAYKYFDPDSEYYPLEAAIYASLHRIGFAIGMSSIVVLITIGEGLDFHYNFLTPRWVPPLSRLTYGAYLIHNLNQSYEIGATRVSRVISIHNIVWDFVPDMVYTFTFSLVLSIMVEGPIRKMEKQFLTKRTIRKSPEKTSTYGSEEAN